jgi:AraC-like DNA-binding protein
MPKGPLSEWGPLDDSASRSIRLSSIAMDAGADPVTLCRRFTLAFGCAPSAYLRQRRVGRAAAAIAAGHCSLSGVAWQSGFVDQAHLTHVSRRLTGVTPGQYRALISPTASLSVPLGGAGRESAADPVAARPR